jgi:malate permease and related proteins
MGLDGALTIRIVSIVFPLFAIAALGLFIGRRMRPDLSHANELNMDVFVPALVFSAVASKDFRINEFASLSLAVFFIIIGSGVIAWAVARAAKIDIKTFVPPIMFNNVGNLGLPLSVLAFGPQALTPAVVMFMTSNFIHFSFGNWLLDHRQRLTTIWRVPSVAALMLGLIVSAIGIEIWPPLMLALKMLGDISIPLMLFSLGVRLANARFESWHVGALAAIVRPLAGLLVALAVLLVLDLPPEQRSMLLVFSVLPPAVLNYIFAERYQQEPDKVASMVLIGHMASIVVLPAMLALTLP